LQLSHSPVAARSSDLDVVLAWATARQAVTPTARAQARLPALAPGSGPFAPADGAFARAVADAFTGWDKG